MSWLVWNHVMNSVSGIKGISYWMMSQENVLQIVTFGFLRCTPWSERKLIPPTKIHFTGHFLGGSRGETIFALRKLQNIFTVLQIYFASDSQMKKHFKYLMGARQIENKEITCWPLDKMPQHQWAFCQIVTEEDTGFPIYLWKEVCWMF